MRGLHNEKKEKKCGTMEVHRISFRTLGMCIIHTNILTYEIKYMQHTYIRIQNTIHRHKMRRNLIKCNKIQRDLTKFNII